MSSLTFGGIAISFDSRVLTPRPWTEAQAGWAAELLVDAPPGPVLELCAGVGHMGLAAVRNSSRRLVMVDVNPVAEAFALANALTNGLGPRAEFRRTRIEDALHPDEEFAVVIADPPWVRTDEITMFPTDPALAIDGGEDGLRLARTCVHLIDRHLADGGSGLLQLGSMAQAQLMAADTERREEGSVTVVETRCFERGVVLRLSR